MAPRGNSVCGIDITKDSISIAQYSASDNSVANAGIIPNPLDDAGSGSDFLPSLRNKIKRLAGQMRCEQLAAAVGLPAEFAIVKTVMVDESEKNVREAIGWDLGQHIVGSLDDFSFDFEPLAAGSDGGVKRFLAVAYRTAGVQKIVSVIKNARISPCVADIDMFALVDVFEANYQENLGSLSLIVHGCSDATKLILTSGGGFVDFDVVSHAGGHAAADAYAAMLAETVAQSFSGRQTAFDTYVTGPLFTDPEFSESVCSRLGNARALDPFKSIRANVEIPAESVPYLAVAVGLAVRCAAEVGA